MTEKVDVIRRLRLAQGIRAIHRETGVHRTMIREIKELSERSGWLSEDAPLPSEVELEQALKSSARHESGANAASHPLDRYSEEITRWVSEGKSFVVIHQLISERYPCSEATVRRYIHRRFPLPVKVVMLRTSIAGEVMEVDFGYLGLTYDERCGHNRKTYVFSGRLRYSRRAYRRRCFDQKKETFFLCHALAFEHFGGVAEKVVPDNLKAAVVQASFEDPEVNRLYQKLALHYGFLISPCLPYHPEHKGGVESDIKYIKGNFWPLYREHERQRGHETPRAGQLQSELERWTNEVADCRLIKGVGRTPLSLFAEEQPALKPLPGERWQEVSIGIAKVQESWRVQFEKAYYSVPYRYVGKIVTVFAVNDEVRIFLDAQLIATHRKADHLWQTVRNALHAPPDPERYMSETRERLLERAASVGRQTRAVSELILSRKAVDGLRPVRALLSLATRYGSARVEQACERALCYESAEYRCVKRILEQNLESEPREESVQQTSQLEFRFSRPGRYFIPQNLQSAVQEVKR